MSADDDYDYWTEGPRPPRPAPAPVVTVEIIEEVVPQGVQFGAADPLDVPAALQEFMFGQLKPIKAEIASHGDDLDRVPPLHTYAILDAAKVTNLAEMLEASGLPHRCLFKGDAYDELRDVAPWIVRIANNHTFTRNLFTRSDAPWHLWDREAGIYVRSRSALEDLWKHFRKFTKIQDEDGKWFYWRFWEVTHFGATLQGMGAKDQQKFFMDGNIESFVVIRAKTNPNLLKLSLRTT